MNRSTWPWMLFKVAGGTILCQANEDSQEDGSFEIFRLTELKVIDPRKAVFEKWSTKIADMWQERLKTQHEKQRSELLMKSEADQEAAAAVEDAKLKAPEFEAVADQIGQFLSGPILMESSAIVWSAPALEKVAKICADFWARKETPA